MSLVSCGELRQVFYPVFNEHFPKRDVQVSATNAEGPPVPIPNTEVKLCSAEDTWLATARENRSVLTSCLSFALWGKAFCFAVGLLPLFFLQKPILHENPHGRGTRPLPWGFYRLCPNWVHWQWSAFGLLDQSASTVFFRLKEPICRLFSFEFL